MRAQNTTGAPSTGSTTRANLALAPAHKHDLPRGKNGPRYKKMIIPPTQLHTPIHISSPQPVSSPSTTNSSACAIEVVASHEVSPALQEISWAGCTRCLKVDFRQHLGNGGAFCHPCSRGDSHISLTQSFFASPEAVVKQQLK